MKLRTPFDSITLAAVLDEAQYLTHSKVQRIIQPDDFNLIIGLYKEGNEHQLLICWHPELYRSHLLSRRPPAPAEPTTSCMTLRKFLMGGRVEFIRQRGLDRIFDLGFSSAHGDFQIVVELMGRHSNMILVDSNKRILACGKSVSQKFSRRPVQVGKVYEPPPFQQKPLLIEANPHDDLKQFEGYSPFLARLIENSANESETDTDLIDFLDVAKHAIKTRTWNPHFSDSAGAYPLDFTFIDPTALPRQTISVALENAYSLRQTRDGILHQQLQLVSQLQRVVDARQAALRGIHEAVNLADRAPEIQLDAELILAYQGSIKPADGSVKVWDFEGNERNILLDPELTPVENANALFKRARHAKERRDEVITQGEKLQNDLELVQSLITKILNVQTPSELEEIKTVAKTKNYLHQTGPPKAKEDRPFEGHPIRELLSPNGHRVLYGTTATSNDYLTNRVAKGNDIWFHVRGQTSAHVVLQTHGSPDKIQKPDIIFAAQVSVRNSVAKHGSYVPVDYTLKKYVRKPRGSAPGLAVYEREKTIHVDP